MFSSGEKDGRSQRSSLANNLAANATDLVKADHGGTMGNANLNVKAVSAGR
jgi:hypothetical protein